MDFTGYTCEQLLAFIADPGNSPLDRASAQSVYDAQCGSGTDPTGQSGGGGRTKPPA